jgi:hypothetical protein
MPSLTQPRSSETGDPDSTILIPDTAYLDRVRRVLGIITLDPCSSPKCQVAVSAQTWYRSDQAQGALAQSWSGNVFLHPHPNSTIARRQVQKLLRDYLTSRVTSAIILSGRIDLLRQEPLIQSFPHLIHWKRLRHWRWVSPELGLQPLNPSFNCLSIGLPAKNSLTYDEEWFDNFRRYFSSYGRIIIPEDIDQQWQTEAMAATRSWPIKPVLTALRER